MSTEAAVPTPARLTRAGNNNIILYSRLLTAPHSEGLKRIIIFRFIGAHNNNNNNIIIKSSHRNDPRYCVGVKSYRRFDGNCQMTDLASWWLVHTHTSIYII